MNPGPELGGIAILAAYAVVIAAILVFLKLMINRERRLKKRLEELRAELGKDGGRVPPTIG